MFKDCVVLRRTSDSENSIGGWKHLFIHYEMACLLSIIQGYAVTQKPSMDFITIY